MTQHEKTDTAQTAERTFLAVVCKINTAAQIEKHVHSSGGS